MSSGSERRVSRQDIQLVQNLIERCLQLYMSQKEVIDTLLEQAKIEPGFTELVWQKLEEENQEFFQAYYLRLTLKKQIQQFNRLLAQQVELMQIDPIASLPPSNGSHMPAIASLPPSNGSHIPAVSSLPTSNGSHIPAIHQNPACYPGERTQAGLKMENIHPVDSSLSNVFNNGGSSLHSSMHAAVDMSAAPSNRINGPSNMISAQTSNMGPIQGINGGMIKSEPGYSVCSPYMFGTDGNVLDARPTIGDASVPSFASVESNPQSLNETGLDPETSSYGFLGMIPRNFSLSDLTAHFSQSSDILESYPRSPFLAADNENFLEREQDNNRLDSISEGLSYEDFGSE